MSEINPEIFHAYDVRGVYPDEINEEAVFAIAQAYVRYLRQDLKKQGPLRIALGQDMRVHSPFLAREVIRGLTTAGADIVDIGLVSSPAFHYAVAFKDLSGGIMVTASHNPKQYNGLKLIRDKALPIGQGFGMEQIKDYAAAGEEIKAESRGQVESWPDITQEYVTQDLSYLNSGKIKRFRIAADPGNAMGATYLTELFQRIDCEPIKLNWDLNGNMPIHEPNPLKLETLQQLQAVVRNEQAHLGIATDGDGDRIAFLDEQGEVVPAVILIGLAAAKLLEKRPGEKIGVDVRSSKVAREMITAAGGEAVDTKIGHSLIKNQMNEQNMLFAGELSGHYYFRENYNYESPVFVTALLLLLLSETDKPFSELWRPHQKYFHSGEINFEVADKAAVMEKLAGKYKDGQVSRLDGVKIEFDEWWFNVRPSNTEPLLRLNLEADSEALMTSKLKEISELIST